MPPFVKVDGADEIRGLNYHGMKRAGLPPEDIAALKDAYRRLFLRKKAMSLAMAEFDTLNGLNPHVKDMIEFLRRRDRGKNGATWKVYATNRPAPRPSRNRRPPLRPLRTTTSPMRWPPPWNKTATAHAGWGLYP